MEKILKNKLNLVYFIFYGAVACYTPFLIVYFNFRGLSFAEIGTVFAAMSVIGVVSQPVIGYITDKYLNARTTLVIAMVCSFVSVFLMSFASNYMLIILNAAVISIFQNSIYPILDSYCYQISNEYKNIQYGKVRLSGSLGYAICAVLSGVVIKFAGVTVAFYLYCSLIVFGIIIMNTLRYEIKSSAKSLNIKDIAGLFRDGKFVIFILSVIMLNTAMGANGNYIGELIKKTGGDVSNLGFLWFILAVSEVPILFFSSRILSKVKDLRIYYICIFFYIIRFLLDSICTGWGAVIAVQALQCITFALYIASALHYLNRSTDPKMWTSVMTIYSAAGGGLGGFIGNLGGGIVLESLDIFSMYKILALICLVSLVTALFLERRRKYERALSM